MKKSKTDEQLTERTIKLIKAGCDILLKRRDGSFLHPWTNIAAGPDHAVWGKRDNALEIHCLKWAFALARLYGCKVVAYNPRHNTEEIIRARG